jgi:hypothetical protein
MVDTKSVLKQLKAVKFGGSIWNQAEIRELPHILHEHENIEECVNGFYEGGVALLVATDSRMLLIDKKPLNFLTVEDLRFDMINEIDYSHRLMGATITISTGSKTLKFNSLNQPRLRKLIGRVQERMSLIKKEQNDKVENQQQHLEEINRQLQMYLLAQHQQLQHQLASQAAPAQPVALPKPDPQLADYLFAQRLLEQFQRDNPNAEIPKEQPQQAVASEPVAPVEPAVQSADILQDARREVFGRQASASDTPSANQQRPEASYFKGLEVNPLRVAYSKLPMMLRNRTFGRPSLHAHSQQEAMPSGRIVPTPTP